MKKLILIPVLLFGGTMVAQTSKTTIVNDSKSEPSSAVIPTSKGTIDVIINAPSSNTKKSNSNVKMDPIKSTNPFDNVKMLPKKEKVKMGKPKPSERNQSKVIKQ